MEKNRYPQVAGKAKFTYKAYSNVAVCCVGMMLGLFKKFFVFVLVAAVAASVLWAAPVSASGHGGAANVQLAAADMDDDVNDPLEPMNRFFFGFNEIFQDILLRPLSKAYKALLPGIVREVIDNVLDNLGAPVDLANDILQGEFERAMKTTGRFVVNTTAGVGGLFDIADILDMEGHDEDFGQTLGSWGVGEGFYLVLPFFGPSNPRDAIGKMVVDPFFDVTGMAISNSNEDSLGYARTTLGALNEYSSVMDGLEQVKKTSVDYYAAIRSMYRQKRKSQIDNGSNLDLPPIPDLSLEFENDEGDDPSSRLAGGLVSIAR